jgi:hypothetical protein
MYISIKLVIQNSKSNELLNSYIYIMKSSYINLFLFFVPILVIYIM